MTTKEQVWADLQDCLTTYLRKFKDLRDDPDFRAKWSAKNSRLQENAKLLSPEEFAEVEKDYLEWVGREFPEIKNTRFIPQEPKNDSLSS